MVYDITAGKHFGVHIVALPDVECTPAYGAGEQQAAQVFYVVATWTSQRLVNGLIGNDDGFGDRWPR